MTIPLYAPYPLPGDDGAWVHEIRTRRRNTGGRRCIFQLPDGGRCDLDNAHRQHAHVKITASSGGWMITATHSALTPDLTEQAYHLMAGARVRWAVPDTDAMAAERGRIVDPESRDDWRRRERVPGWRMRSLVLVEWDYTSYRDWIDTHHLVLDEPITGRIRAAA